MERESCREPLQLSICHQICHRGGRTRVWAPTLLCKAFAIALCATALLVLAHPVSAYATSVLKIPQGGSCVLTGAADGATYTSSKSRVAKVNAAGVVTGRSPGVSTVAIRKSNGTVKRVKVAVYKVSTASASLAAPTRVVLARASSTSLKLKWSAVKGASGYVVYAYSGKRYTGVCVVSAKVLSLTVTGLASNTTYRYKVCACKKTAARSVRLGTYSYLVSARTTTTTAKKANANKVNYALSRLIVLTGHSVSAGARATTTKTGRSVLSKRVWYSTSNPAVATVDANGVITGVKNGACYLMCRTHNGRVFKKRIFVRNSLKASYINFIAHRGAEYMAPENTLAAFNAAGTEGFAGFECDIRETESGDILVCHDSTLLTACGVNIDATKVSLASRANYPIVNGANVEQYSTQYLPSLAQTVAVAAKYNMKLYLHIKQDSISDKALKRIQRALKRRGLLAQTVVFSTSIDVVKRISEDTKLKAGYINRSATNADRLVALKQAIKVGADCFICCYVQATPPSLALVTRAHSAGLTFGAYAVNDKAGVAAMWMIDIGADFGIANVKSFKP